MIKRYEVWTTRWAAFGETIECRTHSLDVADTFARGEAKSAEIRTAAVWDRDRGRALAVFVGRLPDITPETAPTEEATDTLVDKFAQHLYTTQMETTDPLWRDLPDGHPETHSGGDCREFWRDYARDFVGHLGAIGVTITDGAAPEPTPTEEATDKWQAGIREMIAAKLNALEAQQAVDHQKIRQLAGDHNAHAAIVEANNQRISELITRMARFGERIDRLEVRSENLQKNDDHTDEDVSQLADNLAALGERVVKACVNLASLEGRFPTAINQLHAGQANTDDRLSQLDEWAMHKVIEIKQLDERTKGNEIEIQKLSHRVDQLEAPAQPLPAGYDFELIYRTDGDGNMSQHPRLYDKDGKAINGLTEIITEPSGSGLGPQKYTFKGWYAGGRAWTIETTADKLRAIQIGPDGTETGK